MDITVLHALLVKTENQPVGNLNVKTVVIFDQKYEFLFQIFNSVTGIKLATFLYFSDQLLDLKNATQQTWQGKCFCFPSWFDSVTYI